MSAYGPGLEASKGFKRQSEVAVYVRRLLDEALERHVLDAVLYGDNPMGKPERVPR